MLFSLDYRSRLPIYEQLYQNITRMAALGALAKMSKSPVRALAQELGVNPNTVQKAYQLLERDGIIYSVPGKGSFIAEAANALSQQREQAVEKLRDAAGRALDCGLSLEEAQNCVKEVYEGGRPAVNQQEGVTDMIEANQLTKRFGILTALDQISFQIQSGSIFAGRKQRRWKIDFSADVGRNLSAGWG